MSETLIFYDPFFPFDGERPSSYFLYQLKKTSTVVNACCLKEAFDNNKVTCFINLHGSYFPKQAWKSIYTYFKSGNGFIHLGGIPFRIPCIIKNGEWQKEAEQTAYHQQLNIHEALSVRSENVKKLAYNQNIPIFKGKDTLFSIQDTYNFILHVTKTSSIPAEMGSAGPMDAGIYPLVQGVTSNGRNVTAPSVLIENTNGSFAGGRWIFINQKIQKQFWTELGFELLEDLISYSNRKVTEFHLKTNYASYENGERPIVYLQSQSFIEGAIAWTTSFKIYKNNELLYSKFMRINVTELQRNHSFILPIDIEPGLYELTCITESEKGETRVLQQGFWGMDKRLLAEGEPLTCERDYFIKDGRPMPIVGMTYMTSDVARYYLFLPNPHMWDQDMAHMKRAGINYIRTGLWTGWRHMMFIDGHMDEGILRAIDAFILCAKKHELEVTFTFFTFTPEAWEGDNPYLDPRSIHAQKRFITSIVSRHIETTNINWDLINEPSLFDPKRPFAGPKSLHDSFDRKNYQAWLKNRHRSISKLRERWNVTEEDLPSFQAIDPPESSEINFSIRDMITGKRGMKWLDYTLYTMDMHNNWVRELTYSIKQLATNQLITVGQDEALGGIRPSPLFYSDSVNYTTNHTWWLLDDLIWDGIFSKTLTKPNLIQETGIMYVETPDNRAKRSEEELRNILERKYAYAFSTGGAGAVQWLWNTNYYMNNINESNIGAIRADGTEKPEVNVSYDFGEFINNIRDLFKKRKLEDIVVVYPYSNDFSNRRFSVQSTTKLTRTLAYEMNIPFRAISEYHLSELTTAIPKLIIVPSPHNFSTTALNQIVEIVKNNEVNLLFTGPININAYWKNTERMMATVGETTITNLVREEVFQLEGKQYFAAFGKDRIAESMKEVNTEKYTNDVNTYQMGKGRLFWCGLPMELNERSEPLAALYSYVIEQIGISPEFYWKEGDFPGIYGRKLSFETGNLFIFVSEFSRDVKVAITDQLTKQNYSFLLQSERIVMFSTDKNGQIISVYRPKEVAVSTGI
ncbi:hypothetical protein M948_05865 [Virgibacillus sp. CM-4]|uniref:beta-galactosidase n=1 Tax=Virgibacillus sp. CM-4 TaxID=1354277 RepID=UPI0003882A88|nr:beta-galactosidase [Virgibacillus sp. CM-4]EQB38098.1 hypothetical protein M948_05865 [Virgibacillus sp. CM-4]